MCKLVYNKYSPDKKDLSILLTFLCWLIVGFCIIFVGVNNVFAAEYYLNYDTYQRYYDNTGTLTEVNSSWNESLQSYISGNLTTVNGSTGAAWLVSSPIPMVKGHQYSISFAFVERNNIALSSKNKISVSNTVNGAVSSYNNSTYNAETIYSKVTSNTTLSFVFKANSNSSFIVIPFTTTSRVTQNYSVTMFVMEDLGTAGLSEEELNTTINNQTSILNNSIDSSKNEIINNQNQNNEELKDTIKDQFNDCRPSYNLFNENLYVQSSTQGYDLSELEVGKTYTISINSNPSDKTYGFLVKISSGGAMTSDMWEGYTKKNISFTYTQAMKDNNYKLFIISLPSYELVSKNEILEMKIQINEGSFAQKWEPYGEEICINKIDETNDKLNNIDDTLNNSDSSGATNDASNFFSNFTTDTFGLTSVITAPLNIINSITSSSCNDLNLPLPYLDNKYITLPCMNSIYSKYFGTLFSLYQTITFGIVSYWVIVRIFNQVKDFKNPEHDEIEVLDL